MILGWFLFSPATYMERFNEVHSYFSADALYVDTLPRKPQCSYLSPDEYFPYLLHPCHGLHRVPLLPLGLQDGVAQPPGPLVAASHAQGGKGGRGKGVERDASGATVGEKNRYT